MTRVHPEFAYQSRELEGQIDGILGDPPNKKNYKMMVDALVSEYADGGGIEDVNMMSFALVDRISFTDPKGLLAAAADYESDDPSAVFGMARCDAEGEGMYAAITGQHPELARQAIITAFLFKNQRKWTDDDQSLEQLSAGDEGEEDYDEDSHDSGGGATDDFTNVFDQDGDAR
jgi:hypothetical protein